jgi:hypothetical protein
MQAILTYLARGLFPKHDGKVDPDIAWLAIWC